MEVELKIVFKNFIFLNDIEKKDILELRNKEYVRENMINSEPISLENHILFIESLKNKNKTYFAIFFDNQLIGSLNITKNEELIWGLYFIKISSFEIVICFFNILFLF